MNSRPKPWEQQSTVLPLDKVFEYFGGQAIVRLPQLLLDRIPWGRVLQMKQ
jgi:hypothetical protein